MSGLMDAFWAYERALMEDDLAALDELFARGGTTLRGDAHGLLVGHDAISAFRAGRGGAPARRIVQTHVQAIDPDHALVVAVTELTAGGRGLQTQAWSRSGGAWRITAAHVSVPAPALDRRIWRVVGDPLVAGALDGPLRGHAVAVKDLYAVAGQPVGAGNPARLAAAPVQPRHADAVRRLLDAGADVRGIARTDEFAYSLAGTNAHYGTPPNPRAPYRIPGGSSSGSASAVALGHATIGLGTDTSGSIRVPAAYQGLFGIRTSHGAVDRDGLTPLAPSFDTVGWMTRDASTLLAVGEALLPASSAGGSGEVLVVPSLLAQAEPDVAAAVAGWLPPQTTLDWDADLNGWRTAYQVLQGREAWEQHGGWLADRLDTLGPDVRDRFETARDLTDEQVAEAAGRAAQAREQILELVGQRVLAVPTTSSVAPRIGEDLQRVREATLRLTQLATLAGLPAVTVPLVTAAGLPCGVCLLAAPGRDRDLLQLAADLAQSRR